jgi:hypothetical protein
VGNDCTQFPFEHNLRLWNHSASSICDDALNLSHWFGSCTLLSATDCS